MALQGLYRLGVQPEHPDWHRVNGRWAYTTSDTVRRAEQAGDQTQAHIEQQLRDMAAKQPRVDLRIEREPTSGRTSLRNERGPL